MFVDGKIDPGSWDVLSKWHCNELLLPDTPSLHLPVATAPQAKMYAMDTAKLGSCSNAALKHYETWSQQHGNTKNLLDFILQPQDFAESWIGPRSAHGVSVKRKAEDKSEVAKRQKMLDDAKSNGLLPKSYSLDKKIKAKVGHMGPKAELIAHVLVVKMTDALATTGRVLITNSSALPRADGLYNMLPKVLGPGSVVASWPNFANQPNVRPLLPREVLSMKGWSTTVLNMSTCTPSAAFRVCQRLPYFPIAKAWISAAVQSA